MRTFQIHSLFSRCSSVTGACRKSFHDQREKGVKDACPPRKISALLSFNMSSSLRILQRMVLVLTLFSLNHIVEGATIHANDRILHFKGLEPNSFAHPLDSSMREQLSQIPLIGSVTRRISAVSEEAITLDNLARSVKCGPNQLPKLHENLITACRILDIEEVPDLYVKQNPVPNAYTMAIQGKKPFIVVHSSTIDLLSSEEIQSVIAHELGHIKCEHGVWITALNILALLIDQFGGLGQFARPIIENRLMEWQRSAEYTCDRAALLVSQDWRTVANVMIKLSGGSSSYNNEINIDAFLEQTELYEEIMKNSRLGSTVMRGIESGATHPFPIQRVKELKKWHDGPAYRGLTRRNALAL